MKPTERELEKTFPPEDPKPMFPFPGPTSK